MLAVQVDDATDETDTFNEFVLNNIKDALNEYPIEDTLEEYPKYQTEDVNSSREIVRERPVLKGESLWSIAEGSGEQFKICYPKLIAHNGKDVSTVNAGIRERAMKMADELLVNRSQDLSDSLLYDERYSTKWTRSSVNYVITYLDEDVISVVFQDYMFIGSILGEDISMRTYVADINTGIRYKNEDLLKNMDDLYVANLIYEDMLLQHADSEYETMIFEEVLTPHLMAEALQTNGTID